MYWLNYLDRNAIALAKRKCGLILLWHGGRGIEADAGDRQIGSEGVARYGNNDGGVWCPLSWRDGDGNVLAGRPRSSVG